MYIKRICDVNVGPIEHVDIEFKFNGENPKPIVLVGENGSGKTTLISNIVDAFYEFGGSVFNDVLENIHRGHLYYKVVSYDEINTDNVFMISYIEFADTKSGIEYSYTLKHGSCDNTEIENNYNINAKKMKFEGQKCLIMDNNRIKDFFEKNVICYFGANRYEKPSWLEDKYFQIDTDRLSANSKSNIVYGNDISITSMNDKTIPWLLDVLSDAKLDTRINEHSIKNSYIKEVNFLLYSVKYIEMILSEILSKDVHLHMNNRMYGNSRLTVRSAADWSVVIPSLRSLSAGQSILFNMFATIIRYADRININNSFKFGDISGIVVIDEIELHLHASLLRKKLPALLHMFPKVQFIITTHSPIFLLGMDEVYGSDGYDIYEMPEGRKITAEEFSELHKAIEYISDTRQYKNCIAEEIKKHARKTLIVTEGATDWKHMKAAFSNLMEKEEFKEKYNALDFEFLEYEPANSEIDAALKLEMGNATLCDMCKQFAKIPNSRKIIFIADADDKKTNSILGSDKRFKDWGNMVFSFILPTPQSRIGSSGICIEHYYSDDEIKTEVEISGIKRRLYFGNEFNIDGVSTQYVCRDKNNCGSDKINIIDGCEKRRVYAISDKSMTNLALSKMCFADKVLEDHESFRFDFSNFEMIFEIINEINEIENP